MKSFYSNFLQKLINGHDAVLMNVIRTSGSVPRKIGASMVCFDDFSTIGTIGGGAIEHESINFARYMQNNSVVKKYTLNHSDAMNLGMVCGGEVDVHFLKIIADEGNISLFSGIVDAVTKRKKRWLVTDITNGNMRVCSENDGENTGFIDIMCDKAMLSADNKFYVQPIFENGVVYVFGGGHVSKALCGLLSMCSFNFVVYENNENIAKIDNFPDAQDVVCADFSSINDNTNITENDYCVVLTRGHQSDNKVVAQILSKKPRYIGVIGSKKKVAFMHEYLKNEGFVESEILKINSPIGIDIGAVTPEEIAVSIVAQLIENKRKSD